MSKGGMKAMAGKDLGYEESSRKLSARIDVNDRFSERSANDLVLEMAAPAEASDVDHEEPEIQEGKPETERLAQESADEEIADESPGIEVPTGVAAQAGPPEPSQEQAE